jgi:formylglycine-generating enzyme required for sulfatase activity
VPGLKWVKIPAGEGVVGTDSGGDSDEVPRIRVKFSADFYMLETEVTNAQYAAVVKGHRRSDEKPVVHVNWFEARDYCLAIGGRLPAELEWEYAARAGSEGDYGLNPKGREITEAWLSRYAVYNTSELAESRSRRPNRWGLVGMYGNAWEWVADGYDPDAYSKLLASNRLMDREKSVVNGSDMYGDVIGGSPPIRLFRGGGYGSGARGLRSGDRYGVEPAISGVNLGFRCVTSTPQH